VSRLLTTWVLTAAAIAGLAPAAAYAAQDVCITVDEAHDSLPPVERMSALVFLSGEFERAGRGVVAAPCGAAYTVSHAELGDAIAVTLTGPEGRRHAIAAGKDDLPAVYDQMVRSLLTGEPMTLGGVVDRTNVSQTQAARARVDSDSIFYARLGYGAVAGPRTRGVPSVGLLGYRHELDALAIDVSFFNFGVGGAMSGYATDGTSSSSSWLKLEALRFTRPESDATPYLGGGLSYSTIHIGGGAPQSAAYAGPLSSWSGSGLQGELTAGYELARASTVRMFVQADAGLPFFKVTQTGYSYALPAAPGGYARSTPTVVSRRYAPSMTVSIGFGWDRGGHARRPSAR
jgi:hypothetical protein